MAVALYPGIIGRGGVLRIAALQDSAQAFRSAATDLRHHILCGTSIRDFGYTLACVACGCNRAARLTVVAARPSTMPRHLGECIQQHNILGSTNLCITGASWSCAGRVGVHSGEFVHLTIRASGRHVWRRSTRGTWCYAGYHWYSVVYYDSASFLEGFLGQPEHRFRLPFASNQDKAKRR